MFDILCSLPLSSELFAQSLSPAEPLLAVGLATGHVETFRLPTEDDNNLNRSSSSSNNNDDDDDDDNDYTAQLSHRRSSLSSHSSPTPAISSAWRTRRHKGSCRTLCYSAVDGAHLFSGGSDGLVKCADSATGRVVAKIAVPPEEEEDDEDVDAPSILHALTPTALLLGTDSGTVHLYDTRTPGSVPTTKKKANGTGTGSSSSLLAARPAATWTPHLDYVSSIAAVPASSTSTSGLPRAFLSTGSASAALTDIRKGVVAVSAEGNEPLVASALSLPSGRFVVGDAAGNLASWDRTVVASWGDGLGRTRVDVGRAIFSPEGERLPIIPGQDVDGGVGNVEDAGIEVMCTIPEDSGAAKELGGDAIVVGWDTGRVEVVELQGKDRGKGAAGKPATRGEVVADFPPDADGEGVAALGFDAVGRLVVGAGSKVTIYAQTAQEEVDWQGEGEGEGSDDDGSGSDEEKQASAAPAGNKDPTSSVGSKRQAEATSSGSSSSSSEEEQKQKKPKKKKRKGKAQKNHPSFNFAGLD